MLDNLNSSRLSQETLDTERAGS